MNRPALEKLLNLRELEEAAKQRLPGSAYDYFAGGAFDEVTLRDNERAFDRIKLRYRVLVDVSARDLSTTVIKQPVAFPVLVAPTALQRMAHADGEVATARAAARAGTIMTLSTLSNSSVEEVRAATGGPLWLQLYVYKDRGVTRELVERARAAGCDAVVLTADAPVLGRRERDVRNAFRMPAELSIANLRAASLPVPALPESAVESGLAAYVFHTHDASLSWRDLEWLRGVSDLPLVVKGVVRGDDAVRAVEHGAAGVVVSNHGGRQLDTAPATIDVLPEVVDAVAGRVDVLLDGGVRRGTDVLKALALGARAVLVGRPVIWGLAVAGEAGVAHALRILRDELDLAMALAGCAKIGDVTRDLVMVGR